MRFVLNGKSADIRAHPMKRLLDVLREDCGLTGTKEGCGEGECGACTVLLDGMAVNACLVPFGQVRGRSVKTIEGLRGRHPLQAAFVTEGGTQCGICTPGMIMAAAALPKNPTLEDVRAGLAGNICRCTGYTGIYRAIERASGLRLAGTQAQGFGGLAGRQGSRLRTRGPRPEAQGSWLGAHSARRTAGLAVAARSSRQQAKAWQRRVEMRTAISTFELVEPRSLKHALGVLRDGQPIVPIAGCTDVYVLLNAGAAPGSRYLNLWNLDALRGIRLRGGTVSIGALTTFSDIMRSPVVRARVPALVAAAREIGAVQIQNRGTLGGNVANGSPAGDSLPVLAATDASVVLRSASGVRRVPFNAFYTGYRKTVMRRDELVEAIEIPPVEGRQWFRKVGTRAAQAISKVVIAAVRAPRPRVAFGSVAPTTVRVPRTEAVLAGGGLIDDAAAVLAAEITPIDDMRSTAEYRRRVACNLLRQFWTETA